MRNITVALLILALGPVAVRAQGGWADSLFKDGTAHDFGSVPRGAELYHRFTVYNRYAVPLTILDVTPSCNCVTATPSFKTLGPRETGYVEITMDARRFVGAKTVRINITTSGGRDYNSTAELRVSANSRADVVFNPSQVTFGAVQRGTTPVQTVDVEYAGALDWKVTGAVVNGAPVDVKLQELYRDRDRQGFIKVGYQVRVTLSANAPAGPLKQEVILQTNDPATPMVPLLVEATVQAPLTVTPENVHIADLKVGEEATGRVYVRGSRPFKILAVEGAADGITLATPTPSTAAEQQRVMFKVTAAQAGDFRRQLLIKTDLQDAPLVVTVEGKASP